MRFIVILYNPHDTTPEADYTVAARAPFISMDYL